MAFFADKKSCTYYDVQLLKMFYLLQFTARKSQIQTVVL